MVLADYNDKNYDYTKYWDGRDYENESEFIALQKLLRKRRNGNGSVIDVGGGFGRLLPLLKDFFKDITIFDYSKKLLDVANEGAGRLGLQIKTEVGDVNNLSNLLDRKYDCVTMIRVSHHLEDLERVFLEVKNVLDKDGVFILEVANKVHFKSVVKNIFKGNIKYLNRESVSIATKNVTFLNHHPKRVEMMLKNSGFKIVRKLSVSNFRSPVIKKIVPMRILIVLEKLFQGILAPLYFGPSIFYELKVG